MHFFAQISKTPKMVLENHENVNMDRESFMRIIEWLDLNVQATGDLFPNKIEEPRFGTKKMQDLRQFFSEDFGKELADQPNHALVNPSISQKSRVFMLSISREDRGWVEKGVFKCNHDPRLKKLTQLVEDCIIRSENEYIYGWYAKLECGGGKKKLLKNENAISNRLSSSMVKMNEDTIIASVSYDRAAMYAISGPLTIKKIKEKYNENSNNYTAVSSYSLMLGQCNS